MKSPAFLLLGAALFISGCASTDKIVYDTTPRPATTKVEILAPRWSGKHTPIAALSYLGPREEELVAQRRFIEEAKKLGGDAIIFSIDPAGEKGGGTLFQTTAFLFRALVIARPPTP